MKGFGKLGIVKGGVCVGIAVSGVDDLGRLRMRCVVWAPAPGYSSSIVQQNLPRNPDVFPSGAGF